MANHLGPESCVLSSRGGMRSVDGGNHNPAIHADEKSDIPIVPKKSPNNGCSPAEAMEGRGIAAGNVFDSPARRTQSRESAPMGVEGIRERAKLHRREKYSRHHLRQEPYAAILPVRICAGRRVTVVPTATTNGTYLIV